MIAILKSIRDELHCMNDKAKPVSYELNISGDVSKCNRDDIVSEHMKIFKGLLKSISAY